MAENLTRVDIAFHGGQVLCARVAPGDYESLRKALADEKAERWFELRDAGLGRGDRPLARRLRPARHGRPAGRVLDLRVLRALDVGLLRLLRTRGHTPRLERAAVLLARAGENGLVWYALAAAGGLADAHRRPLYRRSGLTVLAALLGNTAAKAAVGRPRPVLTGLPPLASTISGRSYPSAHAATSFAGARMLSAALPGPPLYLLAAR